GRGDHLDRPVFHSDRQAEAAVAALDQGLESVIIRALGIAGMRVERGQHSIDRTLDQRVVVDGHDIVLLDLLIDRHELLEFLVIGRVRRCERAGGDRNESERADQRDRRQEFAYGVHRVRPGFRRKGVYPPSRPFDRVRDEPAMRAGDTFRPFWDSSTSSRPSARPSGSPMRTRSPAFSGDATFTIRLIHPPPWSMITTPSWLRNGPLKR